MQQPGNRIIYGTGSEPEVGLSIQGWNKKKIYEPADTQKAEGKKVNGSNERLAIIETMGPGETEDPKNITN
jgi:hypothetical protein